MIRIDIFANLLFHEAKVIDLKLSVLCWAKMVVECFLDDCVYVGDGGVCVVRDRQDDQTVYTSYSASPARCNSSAFFRAASVTFIAIIIFSKRSLLTNVSIAVIMLSVHHAHQTVRSAVS